MDLLWKELTFGIPGSREFGVVMIRLGAAMLFGALIGIERQYAGKAAGVRTHMLVTLGTTLFVLACISHSMTTDGISRVIQGIVTGIGFIGAGTIIKLDELMDVKGLTTSAGIWIAAAIGVTVGLGAVGLAAIATVLALLVLTVTVALDNFINKGRENRRNGKNGNHNGQKGLDVNSKT